MVVLSPATAKELEQALHDAVYRYTGPVAIRYPRGKCICECAVEKVASPVATLLSYGSLLEQTYAAADILKENGITVNVEPVLCLKPLDVSSLKSESCPLFVIEETVDAGCIGAEIAAAVNRPVYCLNLGDSFVPHGDMKKLYHLTKLDGVSIAEKVREVLGNEK